MRVVQVEKKVTVERTVSILSTQETGGLELDMTKLTIYSDYI
jgi:hypothetical protein